MAEASGLPITVVWADAHAQIHERHIHVPDGACLQDALQACALDARQWHACGIWGRSQPLEQRLRAGDRVELYQPLKVDPKVARRERFAQQGARSAGLFKVRRAHSKSGY